MVMISLARLWAFAVMIVAVLAVTSDLTSTSNELVARSLEVRTADKKKKEECSYFFLQVVVKGKRYQKPAWLTISSGDAHVTHEPKKATIFFLNKKGQLIACDKYTSLEFSNGYAVWKTGKTPNPKIEYVWKKTFLEITGKEFKKGHEGKVCVSEDNSVFVEGDCDTPFKCLDIELMPVCARWADGTLYEGHAEGGSSSSSSQDKPCDTPVYTKPPPTKQEEPCDDNLDNIPEQPCDDDKPAKSTPPSKSEPCDDDKPVKSSPPSKSEPCDDKPTKTSPPKAPCTTKPSTTKEPCPDPSSDPEPHSKREEPEQTFEEEE